MVAIRHQEKVSCDVDVFAKLMKRPAGDRSKSFQNKQLRFTGGFVTFFTNPHRQFSADPHILSTRLRRRIVALAPAAALTATAGPSRTAS